MSDAAYKTIGERVVSFLRDALIQRDPERDIPLAKEILAEIEASASHEPEEHRNALEAVAAPVIEELSLRPDDWSDAVNLITIYLDDRRGVEGSNRLSSIVLGGLLREDHENRSKFFRGIKEWNVLRALEAILPVLDLDAGEVVSLMQRIDAFTANNMARGTAMEAFRQWGSTHVETARHVVDAWLGNEIRAVALSVSSVQILVEGAVRGGPNPLEWRDAVIGRLLATNDEQRWALAAVLGCFAWPDPQPAAEARHRALLEHVDRLPARLVDAGLRAVSRDAWDHPTASIDTSLRLVEMMPVDIEDTDRLQARADCLAEIAWRALRGAKKNGLALPQVRDILPHILHAPLRAGPRNVDSLLGALSERDPAVAEQFAAQWLASHVEELRVDLLGLNDILPLFAHLRGPTTMGGWLLRCLVDRQPALRLAAAALIASKDAYVIEDAALRTLSLRQAEALAHELAGIGMPGEVYISLLVRLARARVDVHGSVRAILLEDAVEDYPGACRETLDHWEEHGDHADPALASLRAELVAHLEQRTTLYQPQGEIPELWVTSPVRGHWILLQNRIFQEAVRAERGSGRHLFMDLALRIPIARGEGTRMSPYNPEVVPMQQFSGFLELPARDTIDRVAPILSRIRHRERAAALLAQDEGGA